MARRKKAVIGLINELAAQLNLAKDPNILVFTPLGGLGPIDIVTLNMSTGEYSAYDVKTKNYRKKDHTPSDGYKRKTKGSLINRQATTCLLYTSPSPRDGLLSRMPSSA